MKKQDYYPYHGKMYKESRDKTRLDTVKEAVAKIMSKSARTWWWVRALHYEVECAGFCCHEDTVRRMICCLINEGGTRTHTFESRQSTSNPGTAVYRAIKRPIGQKDGARWQNESNLEVVSRTASPDV